MKEDIMKIMLHGPTLQEVRVPCDFMRTRVITYTWHLWQTLAAKCSETTGLLNAGTSVLQSISQVNTSEMIALLININLFYWGRKNVYPMSNVQCNVGEMLHGMKLLCEHSMPTHIACTNVMSCFTRGGCG